MNGMILENFVHSMSLMMVPEEKNTWPVKHVVCGVRSFLGDSSWCLHGGVHGKYF